MTYGLLVTLDDVDVTCHAFEPIEIAWGRTHPGDSFEPRRAVLGFDATANPRRGQRLRASLTAPTTDPTWATTQGTWAEQTGTWLSTRLSVVLFDGTITDTAKDWTAVVAHEEWQTVIGVTAVDPVALLARLTVGDAPWPQESITSRAARIEALTPLVWSNDPSGVLVAARDTDAQPALDLLDELAHTGSISGGVVYDPTAKLAVFMLDNSRRSLVPSLVLTSHQILADASEVETVGDIVNDVTVSYVDPLDPTAQHSVRLFSQPSIDEIGRRDRRVGTQLVSALDATARATSEIGRFGVAATRWEQVVLDSRVASSHDAREQLLVAGPGLRVRLDELPPPAAASWDGYVEGWTFTGLADTWQVETNLSPAVWSGPLLTWANSVTRASRPVNVNPDFEAVPALAGWDLTHNDEAPWYAVAHPGASGSNFLRFSARTLTEGWRRVQTVATFPVVAGQTWRLRVNTRAPDASGGSFGFGAVGAPAGSDPQYGAPGAVDFGEAVTSQVLVAEGFWRAYERTLVVPAGVDVARFDVGVRVTDGVLGGPKLQVDIDDVTFTRVAPTTGTWADVDPTLRWADALSTMTWEV
jgi:hypothetical protein